jgi:hypothetical protein
MLDWISAPCANETTTSSLSLLAEIRNRIYQYALSCPAGFNEASIIRDRRSSLHTSTRFSLALLFTCHQIYEEASPFLYAQNIFLYRPLQPPTCHGDLLQFRCPRRYDAGSCHLEILFTIGSDLWHPFDIPLKVVKETLRYIAINCSLKTLDLLSDFPTRWRSKTPETTKRSFSTSPTLIVDVCTAKASEMINIGCGRGSLVICDAVRNFAHAIGAQKVWMIEGYSRPKPLMGPLRLV